MSFNYHQSVLSTSTINFFTDFTDYLKRNLFFLKILKTFSFSTIFFATFCFISSVVWQFQYWNNVSLVSIKIHQFFHRFYRLSREKSFFLKILKNFFVFHENFSHFVSSQMWFGSFNIARMIHSLQLKSTNISMN